MNEELSFDIVNHAVLKIGSLEIWITDTMIATWVIMGILITFAIIVRVKLRNFKDVPTGFQNVVEMLVEAFDNYVIGVAGEKLSFLAYWFSTVFIFILLSNLSGLFSAGLLRPPTADWSMTLALALVTVTLIHVMGVKYQGSRYIKSFIEPYPFFLPINLIGEISRPISLSFRLFGNILSGFIVMALIYNIAPVFVRFGIPAALHVYFDLFAGILQTYIFVTLGLTFISGAAAEES